MPRIIPNVDGGAVTIDNFVRAETDTYFRQHAAEAGGVGRVRHISEPMPLDEQPVIRMNRDTLYSIGVFDLSEPVTITLPDAGGRFISLMVMDQDHHVPYVAYEAGDHVLTREAMGTRYIEAMFRVFADAEDPADVAAAAAVQRGIRVAQSSVGELDIPEWDRATLDACRAALLPLMRFVPDARGAFGRRGEVDPVRHLIGAAAGWAANPLEDAVYIPVVPNRNDGEAPHVLRVRDVPVDAFWSITVYGADGYLVPNQWGRGTP